MIELSLEPLPLNEPPRAHNLEIREQAILEFSDGEQGYLIERLADQIYGYVFFDGDGYDPGPTCAGLYQALDYAAEDWQDTHPSSPSIEWVEDLLDARTMIRRADEFEIQSITATLCAMHPPRRTQITLEKSTDSKLEEAVTVQGQYLDRLDGQNLIYLIQRNYLGLYGFICISSDAEPRMSASQSSELIGAYELVLRDCRERFDRSRWSFFEAELLKIGTGDYAFSGEEHLISKKLYDQIPGLSSMRSKDQVKRLVSEIAEILGK